MGKYVVGLGEALWDKLPTGKKLGGAPANFAYHARVFNLEGIAVSAVGGDDLGRELKAELDAHDLPYLLETVEQPTGTVAVTVDAAGVPQYEIKTGVAWDFIPYTGKLASLAADCRAVCFGSLAQRSEVSRSTIRRFLDAVPGDCLKVFDINLRQQFYTKEILEDSFRRCDILKINDEEMVTVAHRFAIPGFGTEAQCGYLMREFGIKMIILTLGANGSGIYYDGGISFLKAPDVKVVDTVGAGDSFTGAFIGSLLNGKSVPQAHETAVAVSTYICTCEGAMNPIPDNLK